MLLIASTWVYSFCLTCIPLLGVCGQLGFDPGHGKCRVLSCESCSVGTYFTVPPGGIILAVSIGVPSLVILVSYTRVYTSLSQVQDADTRSLRVSVFILALCYFVFILPILVIEWVPDMGAEAAVVGVSVYSWYWCIYIINFFIYIFFWRRVRTGIQIFLKDVLGISGLKQNSIVSNNESSVWWNGMRYCDQ